MRPRASRAVAWMWPSGSGQIHTSVHAGGIASFFRRVRFSGSLIRLPPGSKNVQPLPLRRRVMPAMPSVT